MKIALFSDTYIPDINGVATSTNILRNELVKLGHEVLVITTELPKDSTYEDKDEYILRVPGMEISALYGYRASNLYSFKGMREIKKFEPDVIHVQTEFGIGIFGRIVGEYLDIPIIYTYHTMWADYSHYVNPMNIDSVDQVIKKVISKISSLYGDTCQGLIVPSQKTKDALIQYGLKQKNIYVIPTGLELSRFETIDSTMNQQLIEKYQLQDKFVLTFLGRIAKEKSIDVIIDALQEVIKQYKDIVFLIVGGGPQVEELEKYVEEKGLKDYIIFTGPQSGQAVCAHYQISDVFISASLSETQGLTYIEAMASGIPVIARYDDQLAGVIKDGYNGRFFKEEKELPGLILEMIRSDKSIMKNNALESVKQFSGEVFATSVLEVYNKAIVENEYLYKVTSITPVSNNSNVVSFSFHQGEGNSTIELNDKIIEKHKLTAGKKILKDQYDYLKDYEQITKAYNKALKFLSYRDYTASQMKDRLMEIGDYSDEQINETIKLLEEKKLIDDREYTLLYFKRCNRKGVGINKAVYELKRKGIKESLIYECMEELDEDDEYQAALKLIDSYYTNNNKFSYNIIQKKIREKLFSKGFVSETIEKAMEYYPFELDEEKEKDTLSRDYKKAYIKYSKKYEGKDLKNKLIATLSQKGYNYEDIKNILDFEEE